MGAVVAATGAGTEVPAATGADGGPALTAAAPDEVVESASDADDHVAQDRVYAANLRFMAGSRAA